jgi:hypothetical protein
MHARLVCIVGSVIAASVLALAASAAARRFALNNQSWVSVWTNIEVEAAGFNVRCPLTLEGSFHSAIIEKVSGALIGYVTNAQIRVSVCTGGSVTILSETLPWHIRYDRFMGTLPNITGIRIQLVGAALAIENSEPCIINTTEREPLFFIVNVEGAGAIRKIRTLRADESAGIVLRGRFLCGFAGRGRFRGTAEVFQQATTTRLLLQLVQ